MSILPHPPGVQDENGRNVTALAAQFPVGSQNIKNNAVGTSQIATGAVTTTQILDGTIAVGDLATGIVLQLASTGTARKVAFGSGTLTFSASTTASTTVTHGLGTTPAVVFTAAVDAFTEVLTTLTAAPGATTFALQGRRVDNVAITSSITFYWLAIG